MNPRTINFLQQQQASRLFRAKHSNIKETDENFSWRLNRLPTQGDPRSICSL